MMDQLLDQIHQLEHVMRKGFREAEVLSVNSKLLCEEVMEQHSEWLKLPKRQKFSNDYKKHRELYIVSRLCKNLDLKKCLLASGQEPADVVLEYNGNSYDIQVTECRDDGPRPGEYQPMIGNLDLTSKIKATNQDHLFVPKESYIPRVE